MARRLTRLSTRHRPIMPVPPVTSTFASRNKLFTASVYINTTRKIALVIFIKLCFGRCARRLSSPESMPSWAAAYSRASRRPKPSARRGARRLRPTRSRSRRTPLGSCVARRRRPCRGKLSNLRPRTGRRLLQQRIFDPQLAAQRAQSRRQEDRTTERRTDRKFKPQSEFPLYALNPPSSTTTLC